MSRGLALPRGRERELIRGRDRDYLLNGQQTRALATIGAFRVVAEDRLLDNEPGDGLRAADLRHLMGQGLVERETFTDPQGARHVLTLTADGKELLDSLRASGSRGQEQQYYSGVVKPRELAHDAELYEVFRNEADEIAREGGRVTRVALDYELKSDYQRFLNREDRPDDATLEGDRRSFADAHDLHVYRGHLELPDLRIEYETPDGRLEHRDVELVTEHYSRGQLSGKSRAGFTCYAAGQGRSRGGTPFDPRHLSRWS